MKLSRRLCLCALIPLAVLVSACTEADSQPLPEERGWRALPDSLAWDRYVFAVDAAAPTQYFDGQGGSLLLENGWGSPEGEGRQSWQWAVEEEAHLTFVSPHRGPLDLFARVAPFHWDGATPQTVEVLIDGESEGSLTLEKGTHEVRLPLSGRAVEPGRHRLTLRFGRLVSPAEAGVSEDQRPLAALFNRISILPRAVTRPEVFTETPIWRGRKRRLVLPEGGGAALPLARGVAARLRLGAVTADCRSCELVVETTTPDGADRELWRGAPEEAARLDLELQSPAESFSRLWIRVAGSGERLGTGEVSVELPEGFLAYGGGGDGGEEKSEANSTAARPHVFTYLVDTLRADILTPYGGGPQTSPELADFAEDAVLYERAWSPSSWTLPSITSLLTGVYPFRHGLIQGDVRLDDEAWPTLPTYLGKAGYHSVGISHSYVGGPAFNLDAGFDEYHLTDYLHARRSLSQEIRGQFLQWLLAEEHGEAPLYGHLHVVDPHDPYTPPPAFRRWVEQAPGSLPEAQYLPDLFMVAGYDDPENPEVRHMQALYRGEVAHMDHQFGRFVDLLRLLDLYDRSMVIVVSDHGEEFAEHGGFGHGRTLYNELVRVPLLVRYPGGRRAGTRVPERVSTLDLVPTILRLAQAEATVPLDGLDLLREDGADRRRLVFSEVNPAPNKHQESVDYRAAGLDDVKCIQSLDENDQFGDPVAPWRTFVMPGPEQQPLATDGPRAQNCRRSLERWWQAQEATLGDRQAAEEVDDETRAALRALGYTQ